MARRVNLHLPYARFDEFRSFVEADRPDLELYFSGADLDGLGDGQLRKILDVLGYGPRLSIHGPFMDLAPGAVDDRIHAVTLDRFTRTMEVAAVLVPEITVFHSGYDRFRYGRHTDIWLDRSVDTWRKVLDASESWGGRIAIENIFEEEPESLRLLVDAVDSSRLGLCFDTGHFNMFTTRTLDEWWRVLGDRVIELHLHDNRGDRDEHAVPGEGGFDFSRLVQLCGKRIPLLTLEVHSLEGARRGRDRVRSLFGDD